MIKGVIFDLDGTLADTLPDLGNAMNEMLLQFGFPARTREEHRLAICYGSREFVRLSLPEEAREDARIDSALAVYKKCYLAACTVKTRPYEGITEMLLSLAEKGIALAVQTNKPMALAKEVVNAYFAQVPFVAVLGHEEGRPTKPDPTAALEIAKMMGFDPSEIAFVGDSDVDMKTARNAGMQPIGVTWGYRDADTLCSKGVVPLFDSAKELELFLSGR